MTTKKPMMASFRTTIEELNQALSRMPMTSTQVTSMTIRKAGRLKTSGKPRKPRRVGQGLGGAL